MRPACIGESGQQCIVRLAVGLSVRGIQTVGDVRPACHGNSMVATGRFTNRLGYGPQQSRIIANADGAEIYGAICTETTIEVQNHAAGYQIAGCVAHANAFGFMPTNLGKTDLPGPLLEAALACGFGKPVELFGRNHAKRIRRICSIRSRAHLVVTCALFLCPCSPLFVSDAAACALLRIHRSAVRPPAA